ncbi:MAG: APC family permease [Candidatus Micrarchaeia archaeon]
MPSKISKSSIGVGTAAAVGLGAIIGAGIFVLSGTAIAIAGAGALLAFILVGIVAVLVALELGELGAVMPNKTGASYSFVYGAFGSELGFMTGILLYFSYATSISAITLGFGSYMGSLLSLNSSFAIPLAIALIFVLAVINILGIKKAAKIDSVLVYIKISILLLFVFFALLVVSAHGGFKPQNFTLQGGNNGIAAIFAASVAIFFAYSGFQSISTFTSKVKGGARGAAKAILIATLVSIILYVAVIFALIALVPASSYKINADPLSFALATSHAPNWLFILVDIGAVIATTSASLAMLLSSSRILYQVSKDKLLPKVFRSYDKHRNVAINGVIVSAVIAVIMLFSGNIYIIAAISNFGLLFSYLMSSFALIHFRRNGVKASFTSPYYPYLPVITIFLLLIFILGMPKEALTIGVVLIILLLTVYYFLREATKKEPVKVRLFK